MTRLWFPFLLTCLGISFSQVFGQGSAKYSVYFKTGSAEIGSASRATLDSLLLHKLITRTQSLTITGYADEPGTTALNDSLSYKRAHAIARYLQRGSRSGPQSVARISGEGARLAVGQGDNPQARRVDITIGSAVPARISVETIDSVKLNGTFALDNLLFEGGLDILLPGSFPQLQQLLQVMKDRPTLHIRLEGHICCGGPFLARASNRREIDFNERAIETGRQLSERRAQAVYQYLIQNGIAAERMSWKGFGFERPKAFPEKTNEDAVSNRRVEVRVLSR